MKRYYNEAEKQEKLTFFMTKKPHAYQRVVRFLEQVGASFDQVTLVESSDMKFHKRDVRRGCSCLVYTVKPGVSLFAEVPALFKQEYRFKEEGLKLQEMRDHLKAIYLHPGVLTPEMKQTVENCSKLIQNILNGRR